MPPDTLSPGMAHVSGVVTKRTEECGTPIESHSLVKLLKNRTPGRMLGNNGLCLHTMHSMC